MCPSRLVDPRSRRFGLALATLLIAVGVATWATLAGAWVLWVLAMAITVVAAVLAASVSGGPGDRRRSVLRAGALATGLVTVLTLALVWQATTVEVREGVRGEVGAGIVDAWAAPFGYVLVERDDATRDLAVLSVGADGTVLGRSPMPPGRLAQVSMAGDGLFSDDDDQLDFGATEVTASWLEGGRLRERWSRGFTVEGSEEVLHELTVVAHDDRSRSVVFGCARSPEEGCSFIGVDEQGREIWRLDAEALRPATSADRSGTARPWLVPDELVVIQGADPVRSDDDQPVLAVDIATGTTDELTVGARLVAGDGYHAVSRSQDGGCAVEVLRDRRTTWLTDVGCDDDGRAPLIHAFGETLTYRLGQEEVVIDLHHEGTGTVPHSSTRRASSGFGTRLEQGRDGPVMRRVADDEILYEAGSGWGGGAVGADAIVVHRERRSWNPFARDPSTEVVVVDARDGSTCARARLTGRPVLSIDAAASPFRSLPGCAALIVLDGRTYLLGP